MKNQPMRSRKPKTAKGLAKDTSTAPSKGGREMTKKELEEAVYKLEVSITASPREERQRYLNNLDVVPPPDAVRRRSSMAAKPKLTFAQTRALRKRRMVEAAEFVVTFILIAGIASGLYKWWQMSH